MPEVGSKPETQLPLVSGSRRVSLVQLLSVKESSSVSNQHHGFQGAGIVCSFPAGGMFRRLFYM